MQGRMSSLIFFVRKILEGSGAIYGDLAIWTKDGTEADIGFGRPRSYSSCSVLPQAPPHPFGCGGVRMRTRGVNRPGISPNDRRGPPTDQQPINRLF